MAKKLHWTQTKEGRARMSEISSRVRNIKKTVVVEEKNKTMKITITGTDARRALAILFSHSAFSKYDVNITVERV